MSQRCRQPQSKSRSIKCGDLLCLFTMYPIVMCAINFYTENTSAATSYFPTIGLNTCILTNRSVANFVID